MTAPQMIETVYLWLSRLYSMTLILKINLTTPQQKPKQNKNDEPN